MGGLRAGLAGGAARAPQGKTGAARLWTVAPITSLPPIRSYDPATDAVDCDGWVEIAHLTGPAGRKRDAQREHRNQVFDRGRWGQRWRFGGTALDRALAIGQYEEAYLRFLRDQPEVLDWLCRTASDVYDNAPSNVHSGFDYSVQEKDATHLQDIAVRRCLVRLGRRFDGDHLVEIRGRASEGYRLNPGQVPFRCPEAIQPLRAWTRAWWLPASVEAFWQHNKLLVVEPQALALRPLLLGTEGLWCALAAESERWRCSCRARESAAASPCPRGWCEHCGRSERSSAGIRRSMRHLCSATRTSKRWICRPRPRALRARLGSRSAATARIGNRRTAPARARPRWLSRRGLGGGSCASS